MESVRFRETPEQAKTRQYNNIQWKLRTCRPLNAADYELLRERERTAGEDLAAKFMADM